MCKTYCFIIALVALILTSSDAFARNAQVQCVSPKELARICGGSEVNGCYKNGVVYMVCGEGVGNNTDCDSIPPFPRPPSSAGIMRICTLRHECAHADNDGSMGGSRCMDEYGAYILEKQCFADANNQFCKGKPKSAVCDDIKRRQQELDAILAYLACMQRTGGNTAQCGLACLRTAPRGSQICAAAENQYKQCATMQSSKSFAY